MKLFLPNVQAMVQHPILFLCVFLVGSIAKHGFAGDPASQSPYTSWKTFRSDYGYEFKYPSCWEVHQDSPDEPAPTRSAEKVIAVDETASCLRPRMDADAPNGIGIMGGLHPLKSKKEGLKDLQLTEKHADNKIIRRNQVDGWQAYKHLNIGGDGVAIIYISNTAGTPKTQNHVIRWEMSLFCPTQEIDFSGPTIRNPGDAYYSKFKTGDLALPEPEKTIYESIRCVEPKKK